MVESGRGRGAWASCWIFQRHQDGLAPFVARVEMPKMPGKSEDSGA